MKVNRMFHNYKTEKITREASDAAKKTRIIISSCSVLPPEIVMHDDTFSVIL